MPELASHVNTNSAEYKTNYAANKALAAQLAERQQMIATDRPARVVELQRQRGKLLTHERIDALLLGLRHEAVANDVRLLPGHFVRRAALDPAGAVDVDIFRLIEETKYRTAVLTENPFDHIVVNADRRMNRARFRAASQLLTKRHLEL